MIRTTLLTFSFFLLTACNSGSSDTETIEVTTPEMISPTDAIEATAPEVVSTTDNTEAIEVTAPEVISTADNTATIEVTVPEVISTDITEIPRTDTSSNESTEDTDTVSDTQTLAEYQTERSQATLMNCDSGNFHDLPLAIANLNNLSQQIFALPATSSVNSYANFIALSQLALTTREHTAALLEQLGLVQITQNNDWFDSFCQLEKQISTISTQVTMAKDWQVNKSLLTQLTQYFPVEFTERQIDPSSDLWRLSITNDWLAEVQLTVIGEDFIDYQATDSVDAEIAKAIMVTGDIATASNEMGEYIRISDDSSTIVINIIIPTFEQYNIVKESLIDTLDNFKELEQNSATQILIPYFSTNIANDDFFNITDWINHNNINEIFAEEGQDFTGINAIETFRLLAPYSTNDFAFDVTGKMQAQSSSLFSYEALEYLEDGFRLGNNSSVVITSDNLPDFSFDLCNEPLLAQAHWRPYFILIENASNGLIYTMTKNLTPVIEEQSNLCLEDVVIALPTNLTNQ